jgi:fructose-bisphosphate aldolase, class I
MNARILIDTAKALVADDKGLLAMDESTSTCDKRFASLEIPQTEDARRAYRELIVTTPGLNESMSGAILFDETIRQKKKDSTPFVRILIDSGIIPGIKVDLGAKGLAGFPAEKATEGLDGLAARVQEYVRMGARFARWRAVIAVGDSVPVASSLSPGQVQPCCLPWRIQCGDGSLISTVICGATIQRLSSSRLSSRPGPVLGAKRNW